MLSTKFIHWSGLALLLGGLVIAVAIILHPDEAADPGAMITNIWRIAHGLLLIGIIPSLFGLIGLYARQMERAGAVGLIGFILLFVGSVIFAAIFLLETFVVPTVAADPTGQALLEAAFGGTLGLVFLLTGLAFALGSILFGLAIMRTAVLPRWAGLALLMGGVLVPFSPPLPHLVGTVGGVLLGASYIWLGYALWRETAGHSVPSDRMAPVT